MNHDSLLKELKGVGEKTQKIFGKIDIYSIDDLLSYYPRTYQKFNGIKSISDVKENDTCAVYATLIKPLSIQYIQRMQIVSSEIADTSGTLKIRWFNMPYLKNSIKSGTTCVFYGKIVSKNRRLTMDQPALYKLEQYMELEKRLQPVYSLTKGITNYTISKLVKQALEQIDLSVDFMPLSIRQEYQLAEYDESIKQIHFPKDDAHMMMARKRLVFDEFFFFLLALKKYKENQEIATNDFQINDDKYTEKIISNLGYELTGAQKNVWNEIKKDMTGNKVMNRLIQGDVGSGKTIIAFLSMILASANHVQSALMAPTEVLARQHYEAMNQLIERQKLPFQTILLIGSMTAKEKRQAYEKIKNHEADFVIGTHAVIQEKVEFAKLGLVITDEQHRFGVRQREILGLKGKMPHTMVMSATPIPRTLAVILYGDLEISVIDEMPSNRIPIKNCVVHTGYRKKAYSFIEGEIKKGHQAYIICPMVEESEMIEAEDVLSYSKKIRDIFPDSIQISCLHGKMKSKEKNEIMEKFLRNEIQILVSTTVVEVGVNVPNATVMVIENAERFGLAQLHQLRGRVGRGNAQSYCIMISGNEGEKHKRRLEILNRSNDGFFIANEDLKLRGPGELLGIRQSGAMEFKLGDIYSDADLLKDACQAAQKIMESDPYFRKTENRYLKNRLQYYMANQLKKLNL